MVGRAWLPFRLAMACQRCWSARGAPGEQLAQTTEGVRRSEAFFRSLSDPGIDTFRAAERTVSTCLLHSPNLSAINTRENDDRSLVRSSQGPQEREKVRHHPAELQKNLMQSKGLKV